MSDTVLRHHQDRGLHLLTMTEGANVLDLALLGALRTRLAELRSGGSPPLLLRSDHPTLFSPGWDLKRLASADRERVKAVLGAFNAVILELFSYPGPTAAAITGHAVAGGCLLGLACDLRIMALGRPRLGLAELNLGVPVPAGSLRMLQARLAAGAVEELALRAEGCTAERARELGLVQRAVLADEVAAAAERDLGTLASKPPRAYAAIKTFLYGATWREMADLDGAGERIFLDCWFEPATLQRIAEVARSLGQP